MNIAHWTEVATKQFGDLKEFERITRNILYCTRTDKPLKEAFDKIDVATQDKYWRTRWYMRNCGYEIEGSKAINHGWYTGYIESDELKFHCSIPPETRKLITLSQFMDWQQNYGLEDMIDEYYESKGIVDKVAKGMSEPHKRDVS